MEPVKVIVRYRDGRLIKGFTSDFFPNKPAFHLRPQDQAAGQPIAVTVADLKAVFFVRDFVGDSSHTERKQFDECGPAAGRKVDVTFFDGEVLVGTTMGYDPKRIGFFIVPPDPTCNNLRVFVVTAATKMVRYL